MTKSKLLSLFLLFYANSAFSAHQLKAIKVFGGDLKSSVLHETTAQSLKTSDEIQEDSQVSIGDAVKSLPGVNSSGFSPNSTRPIIRGLDGERIRVLVDELGTLDVAGTSADHVVPINPLLVERIEVVRGPVSLLYGSSALGGLVNIVSSRKHSEQFEGFSGSLASQYQSANNLKNLSAKLDYGFSNWIFHFDGNYSHNQDLKTPSNNEKIKNSHGEQKSINAGLTHFYGKGNNINASFTHYENEYGVVAEEDVLIDTSQDRFDLSSTNTTRGLISQVDTKTVFSSYKHQELEDSSVGTEFKKSGLENRIDLLQKNQSGSFGLHTKYTDLEVAGDEAFLPSSKDLNTALFTYQEFSVSSLLKLSLGGRLELAQVSPEALSSEDFLLTSLSLGGTYQLNSKSRLSTSFSYNERNPNSQELFSNGAHIALGIFESGDTNLKKESALGIELSYAYDNKNTNMKLNLFANRFNDYIHLINSGVQDDTDESGISGDSSEDFFIHQYTQGSALLYGFELTATQKLNHYFNLSFQTDLLFGKDLTNKTYLPRLTPPRVSIRLNHIFGKFKSYIGASHSFEPLNLGVNETNTESYTLVNLGASTKLRLSNYNLRLYGAVKNLFNAEARNHSSYTKDLMQEGALSFVVGAEAAF